ncbi:DNA (cytosine-5-)-methyltransferase [Shewanella psychromarinicola]|uniref:Cytosine-specific methyltransferase n=1 Tax=Shewanella psychromarinicola TaxID=2487742 RepID=A0A3N4DYH4_9GAMM|nr:DNA (cytosine-5-)-methyltransferase [Shewanella psychromarinicola]MCL1084331.1 DNA (cytosine-5-)-methyltransferase [Shewanella psychromarinicola]RPA22454.1 DNA (cytosine-5-)-methyltransferase [Shewanella psychromarinicola]
MEHFPIKATRKKLSLTQKQAANLVGVSKSTWQQWELGSRSMHTAFWEMFISKVSDQNTSNESEFTLINKEFSLKDIKNNHLEIASITHKNEHRLSANKNFSFIDLFAGIGGIRTAFTSVGGGCVFSSEIDLFAQHTYYTNYGVVPFGDITKIESLDIPEHDILCGGFPCQPFSHIGKREGFEHPTQGTMFHEVLRIILAKKPKAIFLENVPGIVNHDEGRTLSVVLDSLKMAGYECHHTILNASEFGIPQSRKRFYLVGFLGKEIDFEFPTPPKKYVDIGDFIDMGVTGYSISKHLQKSYLFKKDDGRPVIVDKNSKGTMKTLVSTYHKIQRLTGTFVRDGETGIRLLSQNECKAAMGFPKDFVIPVSRTQMYRQMGNSVVIPVVEAIAEKVVLSLKFMENTHNASQIRTD